VAAILRPKAAWTKLGISKQTFYRKYVRTGRIRLIQIGRRTTGVLEDEIDALIEEMIAERDTGPPVSGIRSVGRSAASGRFVSNKQKEAEPA
jgi:predicted DNA-binding transcriptional regulator AlpA